MLHTELLEPRIGHVGSQLDSLSGLPELGHVIEGRVLELLFQVLYLNCRYLHYLLRLRIGGSWRLARLGLALYLQDA